MFKLMVVEITKDMRKLLEEICDEHFSITQKADSNLNYLWYLYKSGSKSGEYRPFIYMAELQLLRKFSYLNDAEIKSIVKMMESEDPDNLFIATLTIKNLRNTRIKVYGEYSPTNKEYDNIPSKYSYEILNHELFKTTMNK